MILTTTNCVFIGTYKEFVRNFNGSLIGPDVIAPLLQNMCNISNNCNLNVLPQKAFYAIDYTNWRLLFDHQYANKVVNMFRHAVNFWNKLSYLYRLRIRSERLSAAEVLAKKFCPRVFERLDKYF